MLRLRSVYAIFTLMMAATGAALLLLVGGQYLFEQLTIAVWLIVVLLWLGLLARASRVSAEVDDRGILVVNMLRTWRIPWSDVVTMDSGFFFGMNEPVLVLVTNNRRITVTASLAPTPRGRHAIEQAVNEALAARGVQPQSANQFSNDQMVKRALGHPSWTALGAFAFTITLGILRDLGWGLVLTDASVVAAITYVALKVLGQNG